MLNDTVKQVLGRSIQRHSSAAMRWAVVETMDTRIGSRLTAQAVEQARAASYDALKMDAKIATLQPEAVEQIEGHLRDAEGTAAISWHLDAAKDMVEALDKWNKDHYDVGQD